MALPPFTTVPDKAAGSTFTEANWDTHIRDNINHVFQRLVAVTASVDAISVGAGGTNIHQQAVTAGTAAIGDMAIVVGPVSAQGLIWHGGGPVTVTDQLPVRLFNPTGSPINPVATDCSWLVFKLT